MDSSVHLELERLFNPNTRGLPNDFERVVEAKLIDASGRLLEAATPPPSR
jgi:hypothetical protein